MAVLTCRVSRMPEGRGGVVAAPWGPAPVGLSRCLLEGGRLLLYFAPPHSALLRESQTAQSRAGQ